MTGVELIAAERERQVAKGYTHEHDDGHNESRGKYTEMQRLVIAGALIAAEIDRLQRKADAPTEPLNT